LACGTRFGSPVGVVPSEVGAWTTSAARQPSSTEEDQPVLLLFWLFWLFWS
jgi:hypothetical protein